MKVFILFALSLGVVFPSLNATDTATKISAVADSTPELTEPDAAWARLTAPIDGLSDEHIAANKFPPRDPKYYAWLEKWMLQYRVEGTRYFERYPEDPKFAHWLLRTLADPPYYWKNLTEASRAWVAGDTYSPEIDKEAREEWEIHYIAFRSHYLRSKNVPDHDKCTLINRELNSEATLIQKGIISSATPDVVLRSMRPAIVKLAKDVLILAENYDVGAQAAHQLLSIVEQDAELRQALSSAFAQSNRASVRKAADDDARMQKLRDGPIDLQVPGIFGDVIDLKNYRGKVVLLTFWNNECLGCISSMPAYEGAYNRYREHGYVMVGVDVYHKGADKREQEKSRSLELLKHNGVTYPIGVLDVDSRGTTLDDDPILNAFNTSGGGADFLIDQSGRLVASGSFEGSWRTFLIRRMLRLPLTDGSKSPPKS
jgi:thiol-disulfide isomerase/thioredoxin